jgi:hypothetical protein
MKLILSHKGGRWACAAVMVVLMASVAAPALAGIFSVVPVRIYMTPRDRAVAVTITNEGDTELALQAEINEWKQTLDGTDQQTPSEDLILSPPILKLAPKARQVVRLARIGAPDMSRQLTYRMLVREVPEATAPKDKTIQVPIALAMSMPVFITPADLAAPWGPGTGPHRGRHLHPSGREKNHQLGCLASLSCRAGGARGHVRRWENAGFRRRTALKAGPKQPAARFGAIAVVA